MRIPGYSRYDIDERANIVDTVTGEAVVAKRSGRYKSVYVYPDGKAQKQQKNVHVLLCTTYHGAKPDSNSVVRFIDGDHTHVTADNVEWVTRDTLAAEAWRSGSYTRKPKRNNSFNDDTVRMLYDALRTYDEPVTMTQLAEELQVPYSLIRYTMYGLIAAGKAIAVEGGYVADGDG